MTSIKRNVKFWTREYRNKQQQNALLLLLMLCYTVLPKVCKKLILLQNSIVLKKHWEITVILIIQTIEQTQ